MALPNRDLGAVHVQDGPPRPLDTFDLGDQFTTSQETTACQVQVHLGQQEAEPKATLGLPFLRCTIAAMKKGVAPKSRRRSRQTLDKKILVYFTQAERDLVDKAADLDRRSISSFVANAAIAAAERLVTKSNQ